MTRPGNCGIMIYMRTILKAIFWAALGVGVFNKHHDAEKYGGWIITRFKPRIYVAPVNTPLPHFTIKEWPKGWTKLQ